jgi:hypothetical protein
MKPDSYQAAATITPVTDATATWLTPDGWQQGRGAWGGLVIAAMLSAATESLNDPSRPLRQVMCSIMAPVSVGLQTITTEVLRAGSALTVLKSELTDESGQTCAVAMATFGADRVPAIEPPYETWGDITCPEVPAFEEVTPLPNIPELMPTFFKHIEFRPVSGWPTSGSHSTKGWLTLPTANSPERVDTGGDLITAAEPLSAPLLFGLVDAWWPCALAIMPSPRPVATVSFSAQLVAEPSSVAAGQPFIHESFATAAAMGYSSEVRRLWSADGCLLIDNMQTIAIIK